MLFQVTQLLTPQKAAIRATLAKLGFNRNTSCHVAFGSPLFGGLGLRNLFIEQSVAQLELLTRHTRAGTAQSTRTCMALEFATISCQS